MQAACDVLGALALSQRLLEVLQCGGKQAAETLRQVHQRHTGIQSAVKNMIDAYEMALDERERETALIQGCLESASQDPIAAPSPMASLKSMPKNGQATVSKTAVKDKNADEVTMLSLKSMVKKQTAVKHSKAIPANIAPPAMKKAKRSGKCRPRPGKSTRAQRLLNKVSPEE